MKTTAPAASVAIMSARTTRYKASPTRQGPFSCVGFGAKVKNRHQVPSPSHEEGI
jgi:hypothetical protein